MRCVAAAASCHRMSRFHDHTTGIVVELDPSSRGLAHPSPRGPEHAVVRPDYWGMYRGQKQMYVRLPHRSRPAFASSKPSESLRKQPYALKSQALRQLTLEGHYGTTPQIVASHVSVRKFRRRTAISRRVLIPHHVPNGACKLRPPRCINHYSEKQRDLYVESRIIANRGTKAFRQRSQRIPNVDTVVIA